VGDSRLRVQELSQHQNISDQQIMLQQVFIPGGFVLKYTKVSKRLRTVFEAWCIAGRIKHEISILGLLLPVEPANYSRVRKNKACTG
jgi:hypothetical protein